MPRLGGVADREGPERRGQRIDVVLCPVRGHEYATQRVAHLTAVGQARATDPLRDTFRIGVVENHRRRFPAEFQAHRLQSRGARLRDRARPLAVEPVNDTLSTPG